MLLHRIVPNALALSAPALFLLVAGLPASAQTMEIVESIHDVSRPLRQLAQEPATGNSIARHVRPLLAGPTSAGSRLDADDPVVQETAGPTVSTTPGLSLLGLGTGFVGPQGSYTVQFAPPDTNAAVGTTQVFETVNVDYAVFDKASGTVVLGPASIQSIFAGFAGGCATTGNLSDPVVLFDKAAARWVIEVITVTSPYTHCFAVSTTSDATGTYNRYGFKVTTGLPDYAKVGVWSDGYYVSSRLFQGGATYIGPRACSADRAKMLTGAAAKMICFQVKDTTIDGMLPSDLDGATAPPASSPNYFLIQGPLNSKTLQLYKFHVDFVTPASSTFSGPTSITVAAYSQPPQQLGVPQTGTSQQLDALGNFLMHRLAYRNFGDHESLVVTHSVNLGTGTTKHIGARWYELRSPGTIPVVFQQGTYSPDKSYRWMGSIAMDKVGDIALGYSVSSKTLHPEIRYTGRVPTDLAGKMEAEATIFNGLGSQNGGLSRWGDYSSMGIDPTDDCTFWYTTEYLPATGSFNWATRLFSFKFTTCL